MEEAYSRKYFEVEDMGCGSFVKCKSCGWFPEQEHSNIKYGNAHCTFINKLCLPDVLKEQIEHITKSNFTIITRHSSVRGIYHDVVFSESVSDQDTRTVAQLLIAYDNKKIHTSLLK